MWVIPFFAKSDQVSILGSIVDFPEWPQASYLRLNYFNELWGKAAGKTGEMWPPWGKGHPDISVSGSKGRLSSFCPEWCHLTFLVYHQLSGCSHFGDQRWSGTQSWSQFKRIQKGLCWFFVCFWLGFFFPQISVHRWPRRLLYWLHERTLGEKSMSGRKRRPWLELEWNCSCQLLCVLLTAHRGLYWSVLPKTRVDTWVCTCTHTHFHLAWSAQSELDLKKLWR